MYLRYVFRIESAHAIFWNRFTIINNYAVYTIYLQVGLLYKINFAIVIVVGLLSP